MQNSLKTSLCMTAKCPDISPCLQALLHPLSHLHLVASSGSLPLFGQPLHVALGRHSLLADVRMLLPLL